MRSHETADAITPPPGMARLHINADMATMRAIHEIATSGGEQVSTTEALRRLAAYGRLLHRLTHVEQGLCLVSAEPGREPVLYLRRPTPGRRWWNLLTPRWRIERYELTDGHDLHDDQLIVEDLDQRMAA